MNRNNVFRQSFVINQKKVERAFWILTPYVCNENCLERRFRKLESYAQSGPSFMPEYKVSVDFVAVHRSHQCFLSLLRLLVTPDQFFINLANI